MQGQRLSLRPITFLLQVVFSWKLLFSQSWKLLFFQFILSLKIRKEIRDLTEKEWDKYRGAVIKIYSLGFFDNYSRMHTFFKEYAHDTPRFLPWHRMLLDEFESYLEMVTGDPEMGVPYWDWTIDWRDPASSLIFKKEYWGFPDCFPVGYPETHCLERNEAISPWCSPRDVQKILNRGCTDDEFRFLLEMIPHGLVHANVGGDMAQMHSINDPIFWHHHSFVDYLWYRRGESYKGKRYDKKGVLNSDEVLKPFNKKVRDVLKLTNVKYKRPKSKAELWKGKSSALADDYIKLHGFDEEKIRKAEKTIEGKRIVEKLFGIP